MKNQKNSVHKVDTQQNGRIQRNRVIREISKILSRKLILSTTYELTEIILS
jgi:hypothetical protein